MTVILQMPQLKCNDSTNQTFKIALIIRHTRIIYILHNIYLHINEHNLLIFEHFDFTRKKRQTFFLEGILHNKIKLNCIDSADPVNCSQSLWLLSFNPLSFV